MKKINLKKIGIVAGGIALAAIVLIAVIHTGRTGSMTDEAAVTEEELVQYRQNIGNSMDVKKSILIFFNTQEECQSFIDEHGGDTDPLSAGMGITPQMKDGYFNVVGNAVFEPLFDNMQDGECAKEPIGFGGAFCYFKRLENYSVTNKDEDLREFIKQEKTMKKGGEIDEKTD